VTRDVVTMVALIAVFGVVPFEVAFIDQPEIPDPTDPLWIFNRFIDVLVRRHPSRPTQPSHARRATS
jgi:hypothetical protein